MSRFRTGLVVGKFCPLHRGHQFILDQAQARCGRLIVISYTRPDFVGMDAARRERWLAALYPHAQRLVLDDARLAAHCRRLGLAVRTLPHNDADDDTQRRFVAWLLREVLDARVDAVFTSEAYGPGFAEVLSEEQQACGGPTVVHVEIDRARLQVPVSGSLLREDLHARRAQLAPQVYRDFVARVVILGGESTGKSTLAMQLAAQLRTRHAAEYGRELWEAQGGELAEADLLRIARTQIAREESLAGSANRVLVCDTSPLTTLLYAQAMFGRADPALEALAARRYDLVLLCAPDVPFVQDGTRRDDAFRQWQHAWYLRGLEARGIVPVHLQGDWDARRATALAAIAALPPMCIDAAGPAPATLPAV